MAEPTPRISVIMVDGRFRERYHAVDAIAAQTLPDADFELLWVEHSGAVAAALAARLASRSNLQAICLEREGPYHASACFNAGLKAARGELVVIPDGDLVVEPDFLARVWQAHQAAEHLVMYVYRFDEPEEARTDDVDLARLRRVSTLRNPANYGGCVTARKRWFLAVNGYDEHPVFATGFHANGYDLYTRFKNLGLPIQWHPELRVYHPWHPNTLTGDPRYALQLAVIDYRAHTLATEPFEGLDPARNRPMPLELEARLDHLRRKEARRGRGWRARVRTFTRKRS